MKKETWRKIGLVFANTAIALLIVGLTGIGAWAIYDRVAEDRNKDTVSHQCVACCESGNLESITKLGTCASSCKSLTRELEKDADTEFVPKHCEQLNETFRAGVRCYGPFY